MSRLVNTAALPPGSSRGRPHALPKNRPLWVYKNRKVPLTPWASSVPGVKVSLMWVTVSGGWLWGQPSLALVLTGFSPGTALRGAWHAGKDGAGAARDAPVVREHCPISSFGVPATWEGCRTADTVSPTHGPATAAVTHFQS